MLGGKQHCRKEMITPVNIPSFEKGSRFPFFPCYLAIQFLPLIVLYISGREHLAPATDSP